MSVRCQNPACRKALVRRPNESNSDFARRDYCDRECYRQAQFSWTRGSNRADPNERGDARRLPPRLRPVLAEVVEQHPFLLRAFGERP